MTWHDATHDHTPITGLHHLTREAFVAALGGARDYALVDFPDHPNVGDSAIWLGELALLRAATGRDPAYVSCWHDFDLDAFARACPDGPLLLHGGGNLGDIWPHHQRFRETMLATMRDRAIVQLPQSIRFRDPTRAHRFAALAAAHPRFVLMVRDAPSLAFARRSFAGDIRLVPDSAFAIDVGTRAPPDLPILALLRTDDEAVARPPAPIPTVDWLEDGPLPAPCPGETRAAWFERLAQARVRRGLALLSRGRRIVTDRLHAHILALLLGVPHVALDNDYGKVGACLDAWTGGSPLVARADDLDSALAIAERLGR